jgi:predicted branched-subunit amino acid permease
MLPLWSGAIPVGLAYALAAHAAGLDPLETQLMSLLVFSAAAQVSVVALLDQRAPLAVLVGTAMALNAQLLLVGVAVGRQLRLGLAQRLLTAFLLTDGAYGVTAGGGTLSLPTLLGAGSSMYLGWNLGTLLGAVLGPTLPDPRGLGLDLVGPLTFLAVLVPLVRTRAAGIVAATAAVATLLLGRVLPGGAAVLAAGLVACAVGIASDGAADDGSGRDAAHGDKAARVSDTEQAAGMRRSAQAGQISEGA